MTDVALLRAFRAAKDTPDRDYAAALDMAAVAAIIGYSRAHFIHTFRRIYGETPGQYRMRRRIERAADLLRTTNGTICLSVGFTSLGSFTSRFVRLMGTSPLRYRTAATSRTASPSIPACFAMMWRTDASPPICSPNF